MLVVGAPGGGGHGSAPHTASGVSRPWDGSFALVYYIQREQGVFVGRHDFVAPDWLQSHLTGVMPASAVALAALLNAITGAAPGWQERMIEAAAA